MEQRSNPKSLQNQQDCPRDSIQLQLAKINNLMNQDIVAANVQSSKEQPQKSKEKVYTVQSLADAINKCNQAGQVETNMPSQIQEQSEDPQYTIKQVLNCMQGTSQGKHNISKSYNSPDINQYGSSSQKKREAGGSIKSLFEGVVLYKYCFNKFKIEKIVLSVSEDRLFMSTYNIQKKQMIVYPLNKLLSIIKKCQTRRFKQYSNKNYRILKELCFSLIFKERSFDFQAKDADAKNMITSYFESIKLNLSYS